jgi:hypothetical protein
MFISINLPYIPDTMCILNPSLDFKASSDPVGTPPQAALAPHQTREQEKPANTSAMTLGYVK